MRHSSGLLLGGALLFLTGLVGLASSVIMTQQTRDVAWIGDQKVLSMEERAHFIPPLMSGGTVALGVLLLGAGCYSGRGHARANDKWECR